MHHLSSSIVQFNSCPPVRSTAEDASHFQWAGFKGDARELLLSIDIVCSVRLEFHQSQHKKQSKQVDEDHYLLLRAELGWVRGYRRHADIVSPC